jgi:hypothetical protein
MKMVILPPAASENALTALLQIVADPKAASTRLNEIKQANAELLKNNANVVENQRLAAELETRENRVAKREAEVAKREAELSALARDLERRENAIKMIRDELERIQIV